MKRIITIIVFTACAAVLMSSCQISKPEVKVGVPMTIQASVATPPETKTVYDYNSSEKSLEGSWDSDEAITVVSFDKNGITAVDRFTSTGERGRTKAEFSGCWNGNTGDRIICLYPDVDSYAGVSIFDCVTLGAPFIYIRNLSTPSSPLQDNNTDAVSDVDLMLGEVTLSGDVAHVNLEHLFAVFRIEATLQNLPYDGEPYYGASINSIRIKCVDPESNDYDDYPMMDPVFVRRSSLDVTTDSYTGKPKTEEKGPLDYFLISAGNNSNFHMDGNTPVTKTFFVPVRFDRNLEAGYKLCLQFGGYYYDYHTGSPTQIDVFPAGDKQITLPSTLPLENGKVYCINVTI